MLLRTREHLLSTAILLLYKYNTFLCSDEKLKMDMFGSSVNGFGTKSSDLDMSLTFELHIEVMR